MEQGQRDEAEEALSDLSTVTSENESELSYSIIPRHTKVHMQGVLVSRLVDLRSLGSYEELFTKLEEMFEIEGQLCGPTTKWMVVYLDLEDDMLLVGDDPWHEFCCMAKKIFIWTREDANNLSMEEAKKCKPAFLYEISLVNKL